MLQSDRPAKGLPLQPEHALLCSPSTHHGQTRTVLNGEASVFAVHTLFTKPHPFLQRVRHSADAQLVDRLQGISLGFIGDNTQLNCEVAEQAAKLLMYVPLTTPRIIQQVTGQRYMA